MTDDKSGFGGQSSGEDDLVEIDLNFESMRRFQAEFSPNLSKDGLFIDTGEPLDPGSVVRFRVILPEDFIFLEGTAVVEWKRGAEVVTDGAPGMALRFVTLSPQNQELVEQLVQDHIEAGGTPFDFDVRPAPADFPTDALEGAPRPRTESPDEGYRLTVRRSGPNIQAEALRALSEATSGVDEVEAAPAEEIEVLRREEARGFAILSKTSVPLVEEELQRRTAPEEGDDGENVADFAKDEGLEPPAEPDVNEGLQPIIDFAVVEDVQPTTDFEVVEDAQLAAHFDKVEDVQQTVDSDAGAVEEDEGVSGPPALDWSVEDELSGPSTEVPEERALDFGAAVDGALADAPDDDVVNKEEPVDTTPETTGDLSDQDRITDEYQIDVADETGPDPGEDDQITGEYAVEAAETTDSDLFDYSESLEMSAADADEGSVEGSAEEPAPVVLPDPEDLPTPPEFDSGPEVIDDVSGEGLGSPAFEVSLPEPDDEPDTTPILPDDGGDDVTVHSDEDEDEQPTPRRRLWPFGLAALFVVAIAGGLLWPRISAWNDGRGSIPAQDPVVADAGADAMTEAVEQPVLGSEETVDPPADETIETPDAAPEIEAGEGVAATDDSAEEVIAPEPEPEPEPEPAPAEPSVELAKADALTSIEVEPGPRGTVIRIRGNGSLEDGAISMEPLTSPPRVLVRVRGIRKTYRPYTIESLTPEVSRVRSGLHEERRPPEMWVVVDLTGPEVTMGGVDIRRDMAEFVLARPQ